MSGRCSGHCCRRFAFPLSPSEVERVAADPDGVITLDTGESHPPIFDAAYMADMLIDPQLRETTPDGRPLAEPEWYYTCRHLVDGRDCGAYEQRPRMCREYPYGRPCMYSGCTLGEP